MLASPPKIDDAPGLKWRRRRTGWSARWQARDDLIQRGVLPKQVNIYFWQGEELTNAAINLIRERCQRLQSDMLVWGRGGVNTTVQYDGTVQGLIDCYMTDELSSYREVRYFTRKHYNSLCRVLARTEYEDDDGVNLTVGETPIANIKARHLKRWHRTWTDGGLKIPMGYAVITMLRNLVGFGVTILEDDQCIRLSAILHQLRFPMGKSRNSALTAEQAAMIRDLARTKGYPSIALAQAIQFEFTWRQKDVIGEWVPIPENGSSDITNGHDKWLRGLRWNEIDESMVVHHITSKRQKLSEPDIRYAPMVLQEMMLTFGTVERAGLPASGAVIVCETTGLPWEPQSFRNMWRALATECGIPTTVRNMDTRAGAITEAFAVDAPSDMIRKTATHSNISMTGKYSRDDAKATAEVMQLRAASRSNKP
jgi:hypothetical protein